MTNSTFSPRAFVRLGVATLILLIVGFGSWASHIKLESAVVATGFVTLDQGTHWVQHPKGGYISEVIVRPAERVIAGQPLLRLTSDVQTDAMELLERQLAEAVAEWARLLAERRGSVTLKKTELDAKDIPHAIWQGQERLLAAQARKIAEQIRQQRHQQTQLDDQLIGRRAQQDALEVQKELIAEELKQQEKLLQKGVISENALAPLKRELAAINGRLGILKAEWAAAKGQIEAIDLQIATHRAERQARTLVELEDRESQIVQLRAQVKALQKEINAQTLTSPISGTVHDLRFETPGALVRATEPIMAIVPTESPLLVTAQVAPSQIEQVFLNQEVQLRVDGQSLEQPLPGRVTMISPDMTSEQQQTQPAFTVEIALGPTQKADGLQNGMPVTAFLKTQPQRVLAFLLAPIADYVAKAFRET